MRVLIRCQFYHNALKNRIKWNCVFILDQSCLLIYFKSVCRAPHGRVEVRQSRTAKKLGIIFGRSCNLLSSLLISELVDKCIGSRIHIVMKTDKEIVGTLLGFDDFVSILCKEQRRRFVFATSLFCLSMCFKRVDPRVPHTNVYVSSQCCNFLLSLVYIMYRLYIVLWLSLLDMVLEDVTELYVHFYLPLTTFFSFLFNKWIVIPVQVHASNFPSVLQWDHTRGEEDNQTGPDPPQWQQHHHGSWRICCCFFHVLCWCFAHHS